MSCIVLALCWVGLVSTTSADLPPSVEYSALQAELQVVRENHDQYYLRVDLFANTLELKSGGRVLLDLPIVSAQAERSDSTVMVLSKNSVISPHIPLPAHAGMRLAGRRLPMDFVGRLIEGPRKHDAIYFGPSLMIVSSATDRRPRTTCIEVSQEDMKSLSSALESRTPAILLQPGPGGS